jgi:hypothetical protein
MNEINNLSLVRSQCIGTLRVLLYCFMHVTRRLYSNTDETTGYEDGILWSKLKEEAIYSSFDISLHCVITLFFGHVCRRFVQSVDFIV